MPDRPTDPTILVRLASRDEVPVIVALLHTSFVEFKQHFSEEGIAESGKSIDRFGEFWEEITVWVAVESDTIVGTVSVKPDGDSLYVRSMAVLPAAQGKGFGKELLDEVESFAVRAGYRRLYLSTTPFFDRALRLYEKFGYRRTGEQKELYGAPLITMEKHLTPDQSDGQRG